MIIQENPQNRYLLISVLIVITITLPFLHRLNIFIIIFVLFAEIYMIIFIFKVLVYFYNKFKETHRNRRIQREEEQINRNEEMLRENKIQIYTNIKEDCVICLDELDYAVALECNHMYHRHCLEQLLEYEYRNCPLCRINIVV